MKTLQKIKLNRTSIFRILALLFVVAITITIFLMRNQVKNLEALGYPGVFIATLLANATVFMPTPGIAVVFAMGPMFNPWILAVVAGTGGAIGEMVGYVAGYSGQGTVEHTQAYARVEPYVQKYGAFAIFVLAMIPNPFFDIAGFAAGILKMPPVRFFIACWCGQVVKMFMFAGAGKIIINWMFP